MQKKLVLLFSLVVLAFAILIGRIIQINAMNGEKYTKVVLDQQQYDSRVIPFRRGDIVDRSGTKLATSERVYNVILDVKAMLEKDEYQEPTIKVLKDCFGIAEEDVEELVESSPESRYNILLKGVDYNTAKEFEAIDEDEEKHPNVKGIWLEEDYVRKYPYNSLASDVIGFSNADDVGTIGLEASYNAILNGVDGREYGYLEEGALLERTIKEAENGNTIVSTIDAELQKIVEKHILEFNEAYKDNAEKGNGSLNTAVIIADPQSGEILAQASYPNFDLNKPRDISAYYTEKELKKMKEEEKVEILNNLWRDFCVSDSYEPGSTAKPFTVAAGLETGKIRGNEVYTCGGSLVVAEDTEPINCHYTAGHGTQTIAQSIANSCNVAMMEMIKVIGAEDFYRYQSIFGFGAQTGIDLPGEAEGILQDPELVGPVDLATNSFGQNFNVTMEQMVAGMSALINGGNYYEPHVVKQIQDENGNVTVIHCTYDPETKSGSGFTGRKVKGTIHWVSVPTAGKVECRLYENIVDEEKGKLNADGTLNLNPNSKTVTTAYVEPKLMEAKAYDSFQFMRNGYYCVDCKDSEEGKPVYNRIVSLKSSFKLPK